MTVRMRKILARPGLMAVRACTLPACRRLLFPLLPTCNKGNRRRLHAGNVHRGQRSYLWWKIKRKFYCRTKESPLFTVESVMNLTLQIFMRSCLNDYGRRSHDYLEGQVHNRFCSKQRRLVRSAVNFSLYFPSQIAPLRPVLRAAYFCFQGNIVGGSRGGEGGIDGFLIFICPRLRYPW